MVFKFRLLSDEVKDFIRDIEIRSDQTFFNLHRLIQDDLGYDSSQIASFYLTNNVWEKEKEFTLFDITDGINSLTVPMDKAILKKYILDPRQRLIYVFDIFNERSLFIELTETQDEIRYSDYPVVIFSKGNPPQQIMFSNIVYGSVTGIEASEMDFYEEVDTEPSLGFTLDPDSDIDDDLLLDDTAEIQDAEPEE